MGMHAAGALDGEVAFLAGEVPKGMLFGGGASTVRGDADSSPDAFAAPRTERERIAWDAYIEGVEKAVAMLMVAVPSPHEIVLSGRMAHVDAVVRELARRLDARAPVHTLRGFASVAKEGAQGAALIADGLMHGAHAELVQTMALADAHGTSLDHLYVISEAEARRRLGL